MKCALLLSLCLAATSPFVAGCLEDDSVPTGRPGGALLGGEQERENAEKRENEAPKRDVPTGGGKEFPGQSRRDSGNAPLLTLADMPSATQPTTLQGATGDYYIFRNNQWVPTTRPAFVPDITSTETPPAAPQAELPPPTPTDIAALDAHIDEHRAFAAPGRAMIVPGTGLAIPADWGTLPPLGAYPHRPWTDRQGDFVSGAVPHNPIYWRDLYPHEFEPNAGFLGTCASYQQDWLEAGWFLVDSPAVPVLMFLRAPWTQLSTRWVAGNAVYRGYLPESGRIDPAPTAGEIKFEYPFTSTQPATAPFIPSPLVPLSR